MEIGGRYLGLGGDVMDIPSIPLGAVLSLRTASALPECTIGLALVGVSLALSFSRPPVLVWIVHGIAWRSKPGHEKSRLHTHIYRVRRARIKLWQDTKPVGSALGLADILERRTENSARGIYRHYGRSLGSEL